MDSLKVSADDSDSEDDINFQTAKVLILPPVNANNEKGGIDFRDHQLGMQVF